MIFGIWRKSFKNKMHRTFPAYFSTSCFTVIRWRHILLSFLPFVFVRSLLNENRRWLFMSDRFSGVICHSVRLLAILWDFVFSLHSSTSSENLVIQIVNFMQHLSLTLKKYTLKHNIRCKYRQLFIYSNTKIFF